MSRQFVNSFTDMRKIVEIIFDTATTDDERIVNFRITAPFNYIENVYPVVFSMWVFSISNSF